MVGSKPKAKRQTKAPSAIPVAFAPQGARQPFPRPQALNTLVWVKRESISPNNYNPNQMAPPELRLLKISLLEDTWTQPIVIFTDEAGGGQWIVDGFHRWTVAADPEVAAMTYGHVPVVYIQGDLRHRMMSTVRHNRSRGNHGVLPMGEIVKHLLQEGMPPADVGRLMQMEPEEVERLAERAGMPVQITRSHKEFNQGWTPG